MKKNIFTLLSLICISSVAVAQIPTLTGANINPVVNDSFVSVACDTTGINPGASGASVTWNFATLVPTSLVYPIDTGFVLYGSAGSGYSLLSLLSTSFATSNRAVVTHTPLGALTNFYITNAATQSFTGLYLNTSNSAVYTDPMDVFHFPYTYGSTFTDTYAGGITYAGVSAAEAGTVTSTGDAYGTLILPPTPPSATPTTYTGVLRVHSYQLFRDSANIFGTPVIQTDTLESYTWYQPNYHSPLLTISTTKGPGLNSKVVSYAARQIANHVDVPSVAGIDASLKVYPNPATNQINISFSTTGTENIRINLTDVLGREIAVISNEKNTGTKHISYNTTALSKGLYFINIQTPAGSVSRKVEIQ